MSPRDSRSSDSIRRTIVSITMAVAADHTGSWARVPHDERYRFVYARLLAATEGLLNAGHSYTALSVERLITDAGISRSTFYAYFKDKGDLLHALMTDVLGQLYDYARLGWWEFADSATKEDLRS